MSNGFKISPELGQELWERMIKEMNPYTPAELANLDTVSICKKIPCYGQKIMEGNREVRGDCYLYTPESEEYSVCCVDGFIENLLADAVNGPSNERWVGGYPSDSPDGTPAVWKDIIGPNDEALVRIEYWSKGRQTKVVIISELESRYLLNPSLQRVGA